MLTTGHFVIAFGFASPWWLLAGVLMSAVPILIHFLYRQQHREHGWGAMAILQRAIQRQARRRRLESWLQLLVRTSIILCVAIALARPRFEEAAGLAGAGGQTHRIVVIDASLSMAHAPREESAFDRAAQIAAEIVERGQVGETTTLIRLGRNAEIITKRPAVESDRLLEEVRRLAVSEEEADVLNGLRVVNQALLDAPSRGSREVYLLSDFQKTNWLPEGAGQAAIAAELNGIAESSHLVLVNVGTIQGDNLALTGIVAAPPARATLSPTEVEATVSNFGAAPINDLQVELFIDGRRVNERRLDVAAGEVENVRFRGLPQFPVDAALELRMTRDALAADDDRRIIVPGAADWEILLVSGRFAEPQKLGASRFVEMALDPRIDQGSGDRAAGIRTVVIPDGQLRHEDLFRYESVFLCDVPLLSPVEVKLLKNYVESGGGLIIALGPGVRPAAYNETVFAEESGLLPVRIDDVVGDPASEDVFHFVPADDSHPLLHPFAGNRHAGLTTTQIYRYVRVATAPGAAVSIPLQYDSGDPAIIDHHLGVGRVLLVTTSLDDQWGNWALWPSFLPMVHELTRLAATSHFETRQLTVGDRFERRIPPQITDVQLVGPDQTDVPVRIQHDDRGTFVTSPPLNRRGFYRLRLGGESQVFEQIAVNVSPGESDLAGLRRSEIATGLLPEAEFDYESGWRGGTNRAPQRNESAERAVLSFLVAAVLLLLVDQIMAWRFAFGLMLLTCLATAAAIFWVGGDARASAIGLCGVAILFALFQVMRRRRLPHT